MAVCFLTRATCKNVRQNLIPLADDVQDGVQVEQQGEIPLLQALKQLHTTEAVCEHCQVSVC